MIEAKRLAGGIEKKNYYRQDIISKQWIQEHEEQLRKLCVLFENAHFGSDDRPFSHFDAVTQDEKRTQILQFLMTPLEGDDSNDMLPMKIETGLKNQTVQHELEQLFGGGRWDRWYEQREWGKNDDSPMRPETITILEISGKIYKKLQLLLSYYDNELHILTRDGAHRTFSDPTDMQYSADGKLYYRDHEKYSTDPDKFWSDREFGEETHMRVPMCHIDSHQLTYGALEDVFLLLAKDKLFPHLAIVFSTQILPPLLDSQA